MNKKKEIKLYQKILGEKKVYEMTPEEMQNPITKEIGNLCRHRLEKRWYKRLVIINFLLVVSVIGLCIYKFNDYFNFKIEKLGEYDELPIPVQCLIYGIFILIFGYLGLYYYYGYYRSMALRITEKNFPEVFKTIEEYANRLGIAVPKTYVMQSNGVLNAFSSFIPKRQWIAINSEIFEIAYREHHDMDALNFVIAHEMAHIYYGHSTLHYNLKIWFASCIPLISDTASRTREYSCDRLAQRISGVDGLDSMMAFVVDRHLYKLVDKEDYVNEMMAQKGFFVWLINLFADHPVMCKRIIALKNGRYSGKLY